MLYSCGCCLFANTIQHFACLCRRKEREAKKKESAKKKPAKKKKASKKPDTDGDAELAAKLSEARESKRNRDVMGTKAKKDAARAAMREVSIVIVACFFLVVYIIRFSQKNSYSIHVTATTTFEKGRRGGGRERFGV